MNKVNVLIFAVCLVIFSGCGPVEEKTFNTETTATPSVDTIRIIACHSCQQLLTAWIEAFEELYPDIHFKLSFDESTSCITSLSEKAHIAFISRELMEGEDASVYCISSVAKHGLVIIVNKNNPYIDIINHGVEIESIKTACSEVSWYAITKDTQYPMHFYYRSTGAGNTKNLINFLGLDQDSLRGELVETDIDMVNAIKSDPYGLGYCSHIHAYDLSTNAQVEGIKVVPFKDNFGLTHHFYDSLNLMKRAIWTGKYQCHLYPTIYLITKEKPTDVNIKQFMKWVFTDGQKIVEREGYVRLRSSEIGCRIKEL